MTSLSVCTDIGSQLGKQFFFCFFFFSDTLIFILLVYIFVFPHFSFERETFASDFISLSVYCHCCCFHVSFDEV